MSGVRKRLALSFALSVAGPVLAVIWQWASIEFLVPEPTCGEQMRFDLVGGGYALVSMTAVLPTLAAVCAPSVAGRYRRVALGAALLSACLMAAFWWQLLGLAECAPS